jgi:hypothetical protein
MEAQEMLDKAKERGYDLWMSDTDHTWYSFVSDKHTSTINLELYPETGEFVLSHIKGIIQITTGKCGPFMNDKHFDKIEREMRKILFDLR